MAAGMPNDLFRGDPQDIERGLDEWVAGLERNAVRYQELQQRVEAMRLTATSPGGVVTVTVDANGVLLDARFSDRANQTAPDELGRLLLGAITAAKARIVGEVREVADETLGADAGADRIVGHYQERFPDSPEPERPARRPRDGDSDGDFGDGSIFD
jgi:DNA-binding protein YbaB